MTLAQSITPKNINTTISPENDTHIAFWTLCKMLSTRHLNELHNQLSKWQQAHQKILLPKSTTVDNEIDNDGTHIPEEEHINILKQIIQLCLLSAECISPYWQDYYHGADDKTKNEQWKNSMTSYMSKNIVLSQQQELFVQANGEPIIFSQVELSKRYATQSILKALIKKQSQFELTSNEIQSWKQLSKATSKENPDQWAKQRQELHQNWVNAEIKVSERKKNKETNKNEFKRGWLDSWYSQKDKRSNAEEYQELCNKLDHYNWLDNKVHLIHIQQLHHLLIEILGRLAGFVALFERDFWFINGYLKKLNTPELYFELDVDLSIEKAPEKYKKLLYSFFLPSRNTQHSSTKDATGNWKEKRNYIAHFNYLNKTIPLSENGQKKVEKKKELYYSSILDLLAHVRSLVAYDRKLKNAVAKSFIQLLDRHGIEIKFKPLHDKKHKFEIDTIKPKKIKHLGGGKYKKNGKNYSIETNQIHPKYVQMVKALLEFKS